MSGVRAREQLEAGVEPSTTVAGSRDLPNAGGGLISGENYNDLVERQIYWSTEVRSVHMGMRHLTQVVYNSLKTNSLAWMLAFYSIVGGAVSCAPDDSRQTQSGQNQLGQTRSSCINNTIPSIYYVATSGDDLNPGTFASPWRTIDKAAATLVAGETVCVRDGTYEETRRDTDRLRPALNPANSGTVGKPITFAAYPGESVTITYGPGVRGAGPLIGTMDSSFVIWDGFIVQEVAVNNAEDTGPVIVTSSGAPVHDVILQNLDIRGVPLNTNAPRDNHNGVRLETCDNVVVQNNVIHGIQGSSHNEAEIMSYNCSNVGILHNEIYDVYTGVYIKGPTDGLIHNTNWVIQYNLLHNLSVSFRVSDSNSITVTQNIIYNGQNFGQPTTFFEYAEANGAVHVYNNIGYNIDQGLSSYAGTTGLLDFYNNILDATQEVYHFETTHPWLTRANYNDFHGVTTIYDNRILTWAQWKVNSGHDTNSITDDPLFANAAGLDFHLQAGSPAMNAGRGGGTSEGAPMNMGAYITGAETIGRIP